MLDKLLKLAKRLRDPKKGCPWDRKRVLADIPPLLIEESEEIREAIEKEDWTNLKEEIGDVLFNLCLLIQIAEEQGLLTAQEVVDLNYNKIVDRHTWVFGDDKANSPEEALALWKKNKKKGRKSKHS